MNTVAMDLDVNVSPDHLESVSRATPQTAILELVWNSLDADATKVQVSIKENEIGGVEAITIRDNGTGIAFDDARLFFGSLGGSWKKAARSTSKLRRALHGKEGKGRFKVFALGRRASWTSISEKDGKSQQIEISTVGGTLSKFRVSAPVETDQPRGTTLEITGIEVPLAELLDADVPDQMAEHLAPYLLSYPDVVVQYRADRVDPKAVLKENSVFSLTQAPDLEGVVETPQLRIIEWKRQSRRELHLCDVDGFSLLVTPPKLQAPGYQFTAYLSAKRIRQLYERSNELALWEINGLVDDLLDEARRTIKQHWREKQARDARQYIDQLKAEHLYPFKDEPRNVVETATRQVFDALAVSLSDLNPKFDDNDKTSKSLSFRLLAQAIEQNPRSLQKILTDVLDLPREKQDELAELLQNTTLEHVISASKIVTDRIKFLEGLRQLVFSEDIKPILKERSHLHRIIESETWIFGEQYNLTVSDKSLTEVLRKHRALLGEEVAIDEPVIRLDGSQGIVDLMLSRTLKHPNPKRHEHLIIELKRPTVKITKDAIFQAWSYAKAIASDERFKGTDTTWTFVALSSDLDEFVDDLAHKPEKPAGLAFEDPQGRFTVWARRWSEIIDDARSRLGFFEERLAVELVDGAGLEHLRKVYGKYLPADVTVPATGPAAAPTASPPPPKAQKRRR